MSKKDQAQKHSWKRRVKDWMVVPHSVFRDPHDVTVEELAKHHTRSDCWMAIDGVVYDVSRFVPFHPGGTKVLEMYAGRDATGPFQRSHATSAVLECIAAFRVGRLVESSGDDTSHAVVVATATTPQPPPPQYPGLSTSGDAPAQQPAPAQQITQPQSVDAVGTAGVEDLEATWAGLNLQQLGSVVNKSQLFASVPPEAVQTAAQRCRDGEVDDEAALSELFAVMDSDGKGYIKRSQLRDFLYRLDASGVSEEALLRAPDQITSADFFRLFRQL